MNRTYLSLFLLIGLAACNGANQEFDASGVFEADEVIISSESVGKILRFEVQEGTELKAGQVIGSVDCKNLSLQKSQIEASIDALGQKTNDAAPKRRLSVSNLFCNNAKLPPNVSSYGFWNANANASKTSSKQKPFQPNKWTMSRGKLTS